MDGPSPREIVGLGERAKVLLLGTFHFRKSNVHIYNEEHQLDILSEQRQAEVEEVVSLLARFQPTKVALECQLDREDAMNRHYLAYREGHRALEPDEREQLGFRLAHRLNHPRVWAIDAWGRDYDSWELVEEHARRLGRRDFADVPWKARVFNLHRHDDRLKTRVSLREYLRYLNSEERLAVDHGIYLALFNTGRRGDYTLVDHVTGWWYNRNLRIFANLQAITESPADRILVIIGQGHLPLLRHAVQASYEHELVEVAAYLA